MNDYTYLEVLVRNCIKTNNKNSKECSLFHSEFKKAFNIGRMFQLGIFASYAVLSEFTATNYSSDPIEISNAPVQVGLDLALKLGSLHFVPQVSFNTDEALYGSAITFGGGLRYNF